MGILAEARARNRSHIGQLSAYDRVLRTGDRSTAYARRVHEREEELEKKHGPRWLRKLKGIY